MSLGLTDGPYSNLHVSSLQKQLQLLPMPEYSGVHYMSCFS